VPVQTGAVPVRAYNDGPRITIDTFLKDPLKIQALVFAMADQEFLADALLRQAGPINSGVAMYYQSTPFYSDSNANKRAEFAEVPVATGSYGVPSVSYVAERALAILISDEMQRRMDVDPVNTQLQQVKNTLVQTWDNAFLATLNTNITQITSSSTNWSTETTGANIRKDLVAGMKLIATAAAPGQNTAFGFNADTLVVSPATKFNLIKQSDFNAPYVGNIADENLQYTGKLPNQIMGLDVVVSRQHSDTRATLMQRKVCGFIADELPLQVSAMYRDEPRKTSRCDVQRASAIGIDQPLSVASIKIDGTA
jgi:hypothetical protein